MSARSRGIIVSADPNHGKLIIEASDSEIAQFGTRDLVEVNQLQQGERSRPHPAFTYGPAFSWPNSQLEHELFDIGQGNAVFISACGSKLRRQVPEPPPRRMQFPIVHNLAATMTPDGSDLSMPQFGARTFELRNVHSVQQIGAWSGDWNADADFVVRRIYEYREVL